MLLTNVSGRQISLVLAESSHASQSMTTFVANLTPSEGIPKTEPVHTLDVPPFTVIRSRTRGPSARGIGKVSSDLAEINEHIAQYYEANTDHMASVSIPLQLLLSNTDVATAIQTAFSIHITFGVDSAVFDAANDVLLPNLSRSDESLGQFELQLQPRQASVSTVEIQVEFTSDNQRVHQASLSPLAITFGDFLAPIVLNGLTVNGPVFTQLWKRAALQLAEAKPGLFATKCFAISSTQSLQRIEAAFGTVIVEGAFNEAELVFPTSDDASRSEAKALLSDRSDPVLQVQHAAMRIPPAYHVLVSLYVRQQSTLVNVLYDDWKLAPTFDEFLSSVFEY